jgi:hypothetical protein
VAASAASGPAIIDERFVEKLSQMRQVINVFPNNRAGQPKPEQPVLTQRDETQQKLIEILGLQSSQSAI